MNRYLTEIKWALIFVTMSLLWLMLGRILGVTDRHIELAQLYSTLIFLPSFAVYLLALKEKNRRYYAGHMTYKQGVVSGLVMTFIITLLGPLTTLLSTHVIAPDFFTHAIHFAVSNGHMTREEAFAQFNQRTYLIQGLIGAPLTGLFLTLVTAALARTRQLPTPV